MKKKGLSKKSKRRLIVFLPLSIFIVGYSFIVVGNYSYNIYKLKKEEQLLKTQLKDLKKEEKNKKTDLTKLQDEDYIARYAREQYLYTKDGEYVIKIDEEEEILVEKKTEKNVKYLTIGFIALFVLFIYVILKIIKNKKSS